MRGKRAKKRLLKPDLKYHHALVERFMNRLMKHGKKSIARKILYSAFDKIEEDSKKDPLQVFQTAMTNARPSVEVKSRRVGGASYQVPVEVSQDRGFTLASRWIIESAKKRSEKTMQERLAKELMDASNNIGVTIKKRDDVHKMAEANKAFAHFRW